MSDLPHILVVDDEPINLVVIKEFLSVISCRMTLADDGQEALDILEANPEDFDLILLDRMMPKLNGMEVLEKMSHHPILQHCPVILQTAMAAKKEIIEGINAGAFYYLTKPFEGDMLVSIVRAAIADRQQSKFLQSEIEKSTRPLKCLRQAEIAFQTLQDARDLALFIANTCPEPQSLVMGLSEIFINAIEHGNLAISYDEKTLLNNEGRWEQEVEARIQQDAYKGKQAVINFNRDKSGCHIVVKDEGDGFNWDEYLTISPERATDNHGRGIALAIMMGFDKVEYRGCGNEVYLFVSTE